MILNLTSTVSVQSDQLEMAIVFWYTGESDLSSVRVLPAVAFTGQNTLYTAMFN